MAFCPHCGKNVTSEATKCLGCGKLFNSAQPPTKGKFAGTMMTKAPAPEASADAAPAAPAAAPPAPAAAAPAAAAPAAVPAPKPKPMSLKGTMIGGMGAPAAPPATETPATPATPATETPATPATETPADAAKSERPRSESSGGFLVGDPMAPPDSTPAPVRLQAREPVPVDTRSEAQGSNRMLMVAVAAMLVMAAVAAGIAHKMGLF